jgi:uncharacterized protein YqfB (UPF0267 family)
LAISSSTDDSYDERYTHQEALSLRKERDMIKEEYSAVSKKFGIEQAEWEHERKQYCDAISG